jgi:hypothetical protein
MSKQRREAANMAANMVAKTLFATETAIDSALSQAAQFVGTMPMARQDARLSAVVGQEAMDHAVKAVAALNDARRAVVAAHNALFDVQGQIGLGAVNFGGFVDKPEYTSTASMPALRSVA